MGVDTLDLDPTQFERLAGQGRGFFGENAQAAHAGIHFKVDAGS